MTSKISDFLQGVRNCPPEIVPYHCSNCSVQDTRNDRCRDPAKPRCAEPNFAGMAVLQGVNDQGFNHENILIAFYPAQSPPFYCVCGRCEFRVMVSQVDKWHFPQVVLACHCGRSKTIIVHTDKIDLSGAWTGQRTRVNEWELPRDTRSKFGEAITCNCKRRSLMIMYEPRGFAFFPQEGDTILIACAKCKRAKKILLRGADIDMSEPWINAETVRRKSLMIVQADPKECPDVPFSEEGERVVVIPLKKER